MELLAVTDSGLVRLTPGDDAWTATLLKADDRMQCVAVDPADATTMYIGSRGQGAWQSTDGGATWTDTQLPQPDVFALAVSPVDGSIYAGTEPSMLFKSTDGGRSWRELAALRQLPSAPTWSFPPRPWTSHVRWIAPNPADAGLLLVGIELGGLMRSEDGGETWVDHAPGAQRDVHALAWHPRVAHRAYEAGGGGAAWSDDGGRTWRPADDGRDRHYTWALAVSPRDPDLWYVSASPGPGRAHAEGRADAYIYRWRGSGPWKPLGGGLPQPFGSMPYALLDVGEWLFAGLANGQIYASGDAGDTWAPLRVLGASPQALTALAFAGRA
jgi:photosystem II stability/assembly factor-like uncharacterized protein